MPIPSPIQTGYYPERDKHCKEALRGRFLELEDVKFKDLAALQADAYLAGWAPPEVQRAMDALTTMRRKKLQTASRAAVSYENTESVI
jgi:hypothetical protein